MAHMLYAFLCKIAVYTMTFENRRRACSRFFGPQGTVWPSPGGTPFPAPRRPTKSRQSPSTLRRAGVSRGVRIWCTLRSTPGSCDVHGILPVSRSRQDADAGMPASAPASSLCSLGIPASKRRKSSAQRPALRCRARSSADPEQRLSSASTPTAACPQLSV